MTVEAWLETFDESIASAGFRYAAAGALAGFVTPLRRVRWLICRRAPQG